MENDGKTLIADEGKLFMCICHNVILGKEVYLKTNNEKRRFGRRFRR